MVEKKTSGGDGIRGRADSDSEEQRFRPPVDDRPIHQVRADGRVIGEIRHDTPIFVISVAAELAGMHAQTLRSYDREGLVSPRRTSGGGRRYSQRDIEMLQQVQALSQDEGVNRAGIRRIIELEGQVDALRDRVAELAAEIELLRAEAAGGGNAGGPPHADADAGHRGAGVPHPSSGATHPGAALVAFRRDVVPWRSQTTAIVTWRSGE